MQDASLSFSITSFIVLLPGGRGGHWIGPAVDTTCKLELTLSTSRGPEQDGPHQLIFSIFQSPPPRDARPSGDQHGCYFRSAQFASQQKRVWPLSRLGSRGPCPPACVSVIAYWHVSLFSAGDVDSVYGQLNFCQNGPEWKLAR